jgi:hypothetical protein
MTPSSRACGRQVSSSHSLTHVPEKLDGQRGQRAAAGVSTPPLVRAVTTQEKKPRATLPHTHMQGATAAAQAPAGGGGLVSPSSTPARPSKRSLRSHHTRPEHPTTRGRRIRFPSSPLIDTRRKKEYQAVAGPSGVTKLARTGSRSPSLASLLSSLPRFLLSS